jgi:hypothetical protein
MLPYSKCQSRKAQSFLSDSAAKPSMPLLIGSHGVVQGGARGSNLSSDPRYGALLKKVGLLQDCCD